MLPYSTLYPDIAKALYENVCKLQERKDYLTAQDILDQENVDNFNDILITHVSESYFSFNDRIKTLKKLQDNWDGYAGHAPNQEIIQKVESFLKTLPKKYLEKLDEENIYPNPHGTITLEWRDSNENVISIEFGLNKSSYYSIINSVNDSETNLESIFSSNKLIDAFNTIIL